MWKMEDNLSSLVNEIKYHISLRFWHFAMTKDFQRNRKEICHQTIFAPIDLIPSPKCYMVITATFITIQCKKILGPKSSQNPDRRALHGYSWISIRGILILIFTGNNSGKNKDGRKKYLLYSFFVLIIMAIFV